MNIKNVIILGGYGNLGCATAKLLLERTDLDVCLAGRNHDQGMEKADKLNAIFPGNRASACPVDARSSSQLVGTFKSFDMVLAALPVTDVGGRIAQAAFDANIHYLDTSADENKRMTLQTLSPSIKKADLCFITEAGLIPGMPATLARMANDYFDATEEVNIGGIFVEEKAAYGSVVDLMTALAEDAYFIKDGVPRKTSMFKSKKFDFKDIFGETACYPTYLLEIEKLTEKIQIDNVSYYTAGLNPWVDGILLLFKMFKMYKSRWLVELGSRLGVWAYDATVKPPFHSMVRMDAIGRKSGKKEQLSVTVDHHDAYIATAAPLVSCLGQMLGNHESGLHIMGHEADHAGVLADIEQMGMGVEIEHIAL